MNMKKQIEETQFHNEQKEREQRAKETGDNEFKYRCQICQIRQIAGE
jgi:hypothetical protein